MAQNPVSPSDADESMRPIRHSLLLILALACLLLAGCHRPGTRTLAAIPERPLLILVSIDGFRPDYLERGLTPQLGAIAAAGVRAEAMRPSFPSQTFPNHYSIITGLVPDHHGVVNNTMLDDDIPDVRFSMGNRAAVEDARWWNDGQPLWNTARAAGLRTATMFWPGSEAPVRGHHPDYWHIFDQSRTPQQRVQQVLDWVDLPAGERPHFITLYFDDVDHDGHRHGPESEELNQSLVRTDKAIGQLVEGLRERTLWNRTNLIVLSDHGMAAMPTGQLVILDDHVPGELFKLVTGGPFAGISAAEPDREAALDAAMARDIPHARCWRKDRIPAHFRYGSHRRIPRWVCLADEGWSITLRESLDRPWARAPNPGAHGFDPALDSMAALFIAHGPDFQRGLVVPGFTNVDVYPLMARLLGIEPEPNDGDARITLPLLRARSGID